MKAKELIKKLEAAGWKHERTNGSHKIFRHPDNPNNVSVPDHKGEELGKGILNDLLKLAGLK